MVIYMTGEEFVGKVLEGERDFSGIRLEEEFDFNASEGYREMNKYLMEQDLKASPIIINNSTFKYVKAKGIYLPHVQGSETNFYMSDFREACLMAADLSKTELSGVDFESRSGFAPTNLMAACFTEANLLRTNFNRADLRRADLRGAKNLERSLNLEYAIFRNTVVSSGERDVIARELLKGKFVVHD